VRVTIDSPNAVQVRVGNDPTALTPWQDFSGSLVKASWPLAAGADGVRTVYAVLKDADGNEATVSGDITYVATPPTVSDVALTPGQYARDNKFYTTTRTVGVMEQLWELAGLPTKPSLPCACVGHVLHCQAWPLLEPTSITLHPLPTPFHRILGSKSPQQALAQISTGCAS